MPNLHTVELRLNSEMHTIERKELSIDPDMQMRAKMNQETVEQYADNIEGILTEHPIDVIEVEDALETQWFVVDGFHRYHAAVLADVNTINVRLMKGTYADAVQYAMSANWENGLRPSKEDAGRSIGLLMETAPDFKYDSKRVIKWLETFGIPKSTARNNTKTLREAIDAKRDAKILEMHGEGNSLRDIGEVVGCAFRTVQNRIEALAVQNEPLAQNAQEETPDYQKAPEDLPFTPDEPFFDETELDDTPAINPADAFQKALDEHEAERQETTRQQDKSVSSSSDVTAKVNITLEERIKKLLQVSGVFEDHTKAEVNAALFNISQGN